MISAAVASILLFLLCDGFFWVIPMVLFCLFCVLRRLLRRGWCVFFRNVRRLFVLMTAVHNRAIVVVTSFGRFFAVISVRFRRAVTVLWKFCALFCVVGMGITDFLWRLFCRRTELIPLSGGQWVGGRFFPTWFPCRNRCDFLHSEVLPSDFSVNVEHCAFLWRFCRKINAFCCHSERSPPRLVGICVRMCLFRRCSRAWFIPQVTFCRAKTAKDNKRFIEGGGRPFSVPQFG